VQDLDALKSAFEHNGPVPLYHYERRSYQTIDSNPDLTDNDLELVIIRAVNLPLPKDFEAKHLTTYVKFEFPYPADNFQTDKTSKQSATLNPGMM
jgi:coiled-coil and C2 domain-containing protein 1